MLVVLRIERGLEASQVSAMAKAAVRMHVPGEDTETLIRRVEESKFLTDDYCGVIQAMQARGTEIAEDDLMRQMRHARARGPPPPDCATAALTRLSRPAAAMGAADVRREGNRLRLGSVLVSIRSQLEER